VLRVDKSWQAVLKAAKIERFRWHDLRHHFASRLVQRGVDLNTVRELLGHADISMTLRYSHLAPEQKAAAVAKLAALTNERDFPCTNAGNARSASKCQD
jgi:site-specific recombinase XerD